MSTKRRVFGALVTSTLAFTGLGAAPASSVNTTIRGADTVGGGDFCTNEGIAATLTGNDVYHETYFPDTGEDRGVFAAEGTASYLQPSTGLTFSGRVAVRQNFDFNSTNTVVGFTATFDLTVVAPSRATREEIGHITYNPLDPLTPRTDRSQGARGTP